MNRFLFLLLLLLAPTALAASPSVLVTVSDFTLDFSAPGRVVRLSPTTAGSSQRGLSDSSGQVTFASVSPGIWTLTIEGVGVPSLLLRVPSSSATLSAASLVISQWTAPTRTLASIAPENISASGYISLSGKTNQIGDNGSAITFNGAAVGGGGDTVWTNDTSIIRPVDDPTSAKFHFSNSADDSSWAAEFLHDATGTAEAFGTRVRLSEGTGTNVSAIAFDVSNDSTGGGVGNINGGAVFDSPANYGTDSRVGYYTASGPVTGEGAGLSGTGQSSFSLQYGVTGMSAANHNSQTNIGVSGLGARSAQQGFTNGVFIGLVGQLSSDYYGNSATNLNYESAALLLDNRNTALPIIVGRTNNGTTVFRVAASGLTTSAAGFKTGSFTGITTTNTFYSVSANLLSTMTNVVVVQGGIITGWTVTP